MNGEVETLAAYQPEIGRPDVIQRFRYSVPGGVSLQDDDVIEVARNTFWDTQNHGNRWARQTPLVFSSAAAQAVWWCGWSSTTWR
ncbi:hypothetical protein [Candidatus Poriferisodalis sp.]|uniref:hypothetical protein n=1 Tax=Candidatus Poriferisodalis sp. TaxID=3101277 RepID=UPI003B027B37